MKQLVWKIKLFLRNKILYVNDKAELSGEIKKNKNELKLEKIIIN